MKEIKSTFSSPTPPIFFDLNSILLSNFLILALIPIAIMIPYFKISKLILEGPDNELKLTKNTQPAILTVSFAIFTVLKKEFNFDFEQTKFFTKC